MKTIQSLALVAFLAMPSALHASEPPKENIGLSGKLLSEIPLAPEFQSTDNRRMRMRVLTVAKGGVVALHSHENRPSVEYVLSGTATEFKDGTEKVYHTGDVVSADHTTSHWWRNDTDGDLTILAVDIYEPSE